MIILIIRIVKYFSMAHLVKNVLVKHSNNNKQIRAEVPIRKQSNKQDKMSKLRKTFLFLFQIFSLINIKTYTIALCIKLVSTIAMFLL